jgi:hypothetical protein
VTDFRKKYDEVNSLEENKELENLILLIGAMYQFKVCICELWDGKDPFRAWSLSCLINYFHTVHTEYTLIWNLTHLTPVTDSGCLPSL